MQLSIPLLALGLPGIIYKSDSTVNFTRNPVTVTIKLIIITTIAPGILEYPWRTSPEVI